MSAHGADRFAGHQLVRIGLGGVLVSTSLLKTWDPGVAGGLKGVMLTERWQLLALAEVELLIGLMLLHRRVGGSRTASMAALLFFAGAAAFSLSKALAGERDCGCFGNALQINPWWMLVFDLAACGALLHYASQSVRDSSRLIWPGVVNIATLALLFGPVPFVLAARQAPAELSDTGEVRGYVGSIPIVPERWLGKPLPLLTHIDVGDRLGRGAWVLLLHQHSCRKCEEVIPQYEQLALEGAHIQRDVQIALVEVPPYASRQEAIHSRSSPCAVARLSDEYRWHVRTPLRLEITGGRLVRFGDGAVLE